MKNSLLVSFRVKYALTIYASKVYSFSIYPRETKTYVQTFATEESVAPTETGTETSHEQQGMGETIAVPEETEEETQAGGEAADYAVFGFHDFRRGRLPRAVEGFERGRLLTAGAPESRRVSERKPRGLRSLFGKRGGGLPANRRSALRGAIGQDEFHLRPPIPI